MEWLRVLLSILVSTSFLGHFKEYHGIKITTTSTKHYTALTPIFDLFSKIIKFLYQQCSAIFYPNERAHQAAEQKYQLNNSTGIITFFTWSTSDWSAADQSKSLLSVLTCCRGNGHLGVEDLREINHPFKMTVQQQISFPGSLFAPSSRSRGLNPATSTPKGDCIWHHRKRKASKSSRSSTRLPYGVSDQIILFFWFCVIMNHSVWCCRSLRLKVVLLCH